MIALGDIYRYRQLAARCQSGAELDIEQIQILSEGEQTSPEGVEMSVLLRGRTVCDWVEISELSPRGFVFRHGPWMEAGQVFEVIVDDGDDLSYRFKAEVIWATEAGDDTDAELRFVGAPVLVRHRKPEVREVEEDAPSLLARFAA